MPLTSRTPLALLLLSAFPLASTPALAQNASRTVEAVARHGNLLDITTNDGTYLIRPYSARIVETTFVPKGERYEPVSHAVVLEPDSVAATLTQTAERIDYATDGIAVTITKAPFGIAYRYKGKPLVAEKDGYTKAPGKPDEAGKNTTVERIDFTLDASEALYGAGARAVGMNRRGNLFTLYNKAHYGYDDRSELLNYTMPLAMSSKLYAIHFDNAQIGHLDFDSGKNNTLAYDTIGGRKTYQVIAGDTWEELIGSYTRLTGKQPLPPRWAFGNFASRFGYHSEQEARDVVARFAKDDIPLDAIVFDLYWFGKSIKSTMGNLAFDQDNFPQPKKMIADFAAQGVKTVLITEPFIVTTSKKWQEAVDKQVLATDAAGKAATYEFYFGTTGLVDIYKPEGRQWFWDIYKNLRTQYGVAGWWGDLGEPEVHPSSVRHATGTADQVHNVYGHDWARLIHEGYRKDFPGERPFNLMRAGYSGSQRFGLIPWSGDVNRSWGGLRAQPEIALQMGMQGLGYMHSDLGGFANAVLDDELYTRWLQYGVFQPVFRPHAQEEVASEPVFREAQTKARARAAIRLRYSLLPYNYTLGFDNNQLGLPLMRPLMFAEPGNENLRAVSANYLWGADLLVAPVTEAGAARQQVYFPAGSTWFDFYSGRSYRGGITAAIPVTIEHIPVFVRAGAFIPMVEPVRSTRDYSTRALQLHYYHDAAVQTASGKLYDDDGATADAYEQGKYELLAFSGAFDGKQLRIGLRSAVGHAYVRPSRSVALTVHNVDARPLAVTHDGRPARFAWHGARRALTVQLPASAHAARDVVVTLAR